MPESFEQHFAKLEGKEKSLEQIKEERSLKLAEEIMAIKKEMEKEETIEGYKRIIELARQIKELNEKEKIEVKIIVENLKELLEKGAIEGSVVLGLTGIGTPEAMAMRERLIEEGANKDYVAQGLAGIGTPEAMAMREGFMKERVNKDYVAQSLAGVNTKEAEEFRKKYFGDDPTLFAKSYSAESTIYNGIICRYGYEK